jgi:hypothetical protein
MFNNLRGMTSVDVTDMYMHNNFSHKPKFGFMSLRLRSQIMATSKE